MQALVALIVTLARTFRFEGTRSGDEAPLDDVCETGGIDESMISAA